MANWQAGPVAVTFRARHESTPCFQVHRFSNDCGLHWLMYVNDLTDNQIIHDRNEGPSRWNISHLAEPIQSASAHMRHLLCMSGDYKALWYSCQIFPRIVDARSTRILAYCDPTGIIGRKRTLNLLC